MDLRLPYFNPRKGGPASPMLSDDGALLTQDLNGWLYHAAKQGRSFTGNSAAAGSVLPIHTNTAQVFGLWNPAGSGVCGIITSLASTYVSTTGAAGGYVLAAVKNAGASIATGGISVFTEGTPENSLIGMVGGNKIRFTPSAATVVGPVLFRHLGINQLVTTATTATTTTFGFAKEFSGDLLLPPNNALFLAGNIATLTIWAASISWVEEPM